MIDRRIVALLAMPLLLCGGVRGQAAGQGVTARVGDIIVKAQRWERVGDKILADGNVEVRYPGITLFADHVEIETKIKDVLAVGKVVLHIVDPEKTAAGGTPANPAATNPTDPSSPPPYTPADEVISAERLEFNLDTAQGNLQKAFGFLQPTFFFQADSLVRKDGIDAMERMSFTSCAQTVPLWRFSCIRANLKKDEYIEMWGAKFSIKRVPVFYWPYMRYPLNQDRATGFLMPGLGYSGRKGMIFSQSFYWAIARNADATFQADYYGSKGMGGGTDWRYIFNEGTGGQLRLYCFTFKKTGETATGATSVPIPDALIVRWSHNQRLPGGFSLTADVDYQSSTDFLREFDNNFQRATVANRRSQVYLTKSWSFLSMSVRTAQFETIFPGGNNSLITRYLPQVSLNSFTMKIAGPVYFSFGGSFSRQQYGWKDAYEAGTQLRTQSLNFSPVLRAPFSLAPWLSVDTSIQANFNYFWQRYETPAGGGGRQVVNDPFLAAGYGFNLSLTGPSFFRIYGQKSDHPVKHLIEPTASYRYESLVANRDMIVSIGGFFRYHQLSYGLTNHLFMKDGGMGSTNPAREIFTLGINQVFYLAPEQGPLSWYRVDGKAPRFSEISSYLRFYPTAKISVDFSAGYNPYYKMVSTLRLGANLGLPTDDLFLNVNWFKSINAWLLGPYKVANIPISFTSLWDRHQISFTGGAKIPRLNLEARGEVDFNIAEKKLLFTAGDFVYHFQCLDLKASVIVFFYRDVPEAQFNFSVGLGNIGSASNLLDRKGP